MAIKSMSIGFKSSSLDSTKQRTKTDLVQVLPISYYDIYTAKK